MLNYYNLYCNLNILGLHDVFRLNVSRCFSIFPDRFLKSREEEEEQQLFEEEWQVEHLGKETYQHNTKMARWFMVLRKGRVFQEIRWKKTKASKWSMILENRKNRKSILENK